MQSPGETAPAPPRLSRTREFVVPFAAESQSTAGDQIGRVALSVLVFDRTGSVAWTALTYALTYLPAILGGVLLGGIGDRYPRVAVMVVVDGARALLFGAVGIPGVPLPVVTALVTVAVFLGPAFTSSLISRMSAALTPDHFRTASGYRMVSAQAAQVAGFAVGGIIVAAVHPRVALLIDAATFAVSAMIVGTALRGRSVGQRTQTSPGPATVNGELAVSREPAARLFGDPALRVLMLMTMLSAFFVVPEGLAVPVSRGLGVSIQVTGVLLAAGPLGSALGAALLVRYVPHRHGLGVARVMSVVCGIPLLVTVTSPPWPILAAAWAATGALWAFQVDVTIAFVQAVDERVRSRAVARASAVLLGAQGVGLIVFGAVGTLISANGAVALAGLTGMLGAAALAIHGVAFGRGARRKRATQQCGSA